MDINKIYETVKNGGLVISKTDTIYGIMADATNEEAIKKVYYAKQRPFNKPLILLMDSYEMVKEYTSAITPPEETLIKEFMPGLVTIILKKNDKVSNIITANSDYVGIRIPDDQELLTIIKKLGHPVISTSANISEEEVIINTSMLDERLKNKIDYIEDSGTIEANSSTIVKFENNDLKILREGLLTNKIKERFIR